MSAVPDLNDLTFQTPGLQPDQKFVADALIQIHRRGEGVAFPPGAVGFAANLEVEKGVRLIADASVFVGDLVTVLFLIAKVRLRYDQNFVFLRDRSRG